MGDAQGGSGESRGTIAARERAVLLTLAAVQFTSIVDFMVIMPLGPQLMRTLGISPAQFGLIVSSYTISAGIAGVVASSLIDRFGRKAAFLALYVGFLVGTLFCGLAPTYPLLLAARVVTGAFGGVLGGMAMAIIGDVFPDERRGRATGILMSAFSLASVFGVPFGLYPGHPIRLARAVPDAGGAGPAGPGERGRRRSRRSATTWPKAGRTTWDSAGRDLHPPEPPPGVRAGDLVDARDVHGRAVHQPVFRLERRAAREPNCPGSTSAAGSVP